MEKKSDQSLVNQLHHLKTIPKGTNDRQNYLTNLLNVPQDEGEVKFPVDKWPNQTKIQARGVQHHIYYWEPKGPAQGLVFVMHGMDGHAGVGAYLAGQLVKNNNVVAVGMDFRNFGQTVTADKKGYIGSVQLLIEDAEQILTLMLKKYQHPKRVFLTGLSMGGAIAFRMAIRSKVDISGIIMFAPALRQNTAASPYMKKVAKVIGFFLPSLELQNANGQRFSVKYKNFKLSDDPFSYAGKVIPGSVRSVLNFQDENSKMYKHLKTPYLMLMAGVDKVCDPFLAVDLESESPSKDKTTYIFKNVWHNIWRSEEMLQIVPIVQKWLEERLPK